MSLRRFNIFSSNASINSRRTTRNARPPSYSSNTTIAPAPIYDPSVNGSLVGTRIESWPTGSTLSTVESDSDQTESHTDTGMTRRTSAGPGGPRYIYYRVYAEDGAIQSANQVYSNDPYLGRILAELVAPPHIAISLKHCLLSVESIDDKTPSNLFIAASSRTPMDDAGRVSILAYPGPGCSPSDPMALVVKTSELGRRPVGEKKPESAFLPSHEGPTPFEMQYIYYRVYKQHAAVLSKKPADPNNPTIGRISVDSVPPPHTASSIIRCISKIEEFHNTKNSQLFMNISSEFALDDGHVSLLSSDRPGSTPENPMAFVFEPVLAVTSVAPAAASLPYPSFTKRIRVIKGQLSDDRNPNWLATTPGEILRTTKAPAQPQPWIRPNGGIFQGPGQYLAYTVVNSAGQLGFVYVDNVKSC